MVWHGRAIGPSAMPNGISVSDLCRKHGASDASIYKWKANFGRKDGETGKQMIQ